MEIFTAASRTTLSSLQLEPESGLGESVTNGDRKGSMLAWHLNRWALGVNGGRADASWLADLSGFGGYPLAEFRRRIGMMEPALEKMDGGFFGWEFVISANLWCSSAPVERICLVHAGWMNECERLADETGLPVSLAECLLRSWLMPLFRCSTATEVVLLSLHEDDDPSQWNPEKIQGRIKDAEALAETDLNRADPLPQGVWRLRKGGWEGVASANDLELAAALRHEPGNPPREVERALAHGRNPVLRSALISPQTFRDVRNIELRGLDRIQRERQKRFEEREQVKQSERSRLEDKFGGRTRSIQLGRHVRALLKRIFSGKSSS